ncbi:MAG: hypothetical protein AAF705_21475, partial [Bacteroidota bacterium]
MGVDLSLMAIPKIGKRLIDKAANRKGSEYADLLFHTFAALQVNFQDFGHPDWIEFKTDVSTLLPHFKDKDLQKYHLDTNRMYDAMDYLIGQMQASNPKQPTNFRTQESFYYTGIECDFCKSTQGYKLKYWDIEMIRNKKSLLDKYTFKQLINTYDEADMIRQHVYKIDQINATPKLKLKGLFEATTTFLSHAEQLGGYV